MNRILTIISVIKCDFLLRQPQSIHVQRRPDSVASREGSGSRLKQRPRACNCCLTPTIIHILGLSASRFLFSLTLNVGNSTIRRRGTDGHLTLAYRPQVPNPKLQRPRECGHIANEQEGAQKANPRQQPHAAVRSIQLSTRIPETKDLHFNQCPITHPPFYQFKSYLQDFQKILDQNVCEVVLQACTKTFSTNVVFLRRF